MRKLLQDVEIMNLEIFRMSLKRSLKMMLASIVSVSCFCLAEGEAGAEFGISADFYSKYIWRGQNVSDDYVFQPSVSLTIDKLTAGVWANVDLTSINNNSGEIIESDLFLEYSDSVGGLDGLGYKLGVINYHFPSVAGDTTELYWGLSLPEVAFSPSVTVYHDIDVADGTYINFGGSYSIEDCFEVSESLPVGMDFSASIGWGDSDYNNYYWGISDGKVNDLSLSLSFPMQIGEWAFAPSLNYVTILSDDVRKSDSFSKESDYFFTGLVLSRSF
jgi:hypothetical protein